MEYAGLCFAEGLELKRKRGFAFYERPSMPSMTEKKGLFYDQAFYPQGPRDTERERANSFPVSLFVALEESFHFEGFHGFLGRQRKIVYCRSFQSKGANGYLEEAIRVRKIVLNHPPNRFPHIGRFN